MEKIGINCDKIKRATQILKGDRGYVRTGEKPLLWEKNLKKKQNQQNRNKKKVIEIN